MRKEGFLCELSENSVRINQERENHGNFERHEPDIAVRSTRFIFVREKLAGKGILGYLSL